MDLGLCSLISKDLGAALDVKEAIDRAYTLEVSSPGLERPLLRPEDYERFVDRKAAITTLRAIEGRRRFKGNIKGFADGQVVLSNGNGQSVSIPFDNVKKAKLVFELKSSGANAGD